MDKLVTFSARLALEKLTGSSKGFWTKKIKKNSETIVLTRFYFPSELVWKYPTKAKFFYDFDCGICETNLPLAGLNNPEELKQNLQALTHRIRTEASDLRLKLKERLPQSEVEKIETFKQFQKAIKELPDCFATRQFTGGEATVQGLRNLTETYSSLLQKTIGFQYFRFTETTVEFVGVEETEEAKLLLDYLVAFAEQHHKIPKRATLTPENERYTFRCWLVRLGWLGRETTKQRQALCHKLSGNSAFRTETSHEQWKLNRKLEKEQEQAEA